MASGDTLARFLAQDNETPSSSSALIDTRNSHPVLNFDAGTALDAVFSDVMPSNYSGGGITVIPYAMAGTATAGTMVWTAALENDTNHDLDGDGFATGLNGTLVASGTSGILGTIGISFSNGAAMDSIVAGDPYRLKITRNVSDAQDGMAGTAQLKAVVIKEN